MYVSVEVPEIPDYAKGFLGYWVKSLFIGSVSSNYQVNALANTYVRLVEAALVEYRLGASMIKEFWDQSGDFKLGAINRSVSHFESCLSDMHRAINCYSRLRRHKDQDPLCLALNTEKPKFISGPVTHQIRLIRDEIHHLEQRVMDGRIQEGQPIAIKPDGPEVPHPTEQNQTNKSIDRLVIGQFELLFSDLAASLTEMARFADKIAQHGPTSSSERAQ